MTKKKTVLRAWRTLSKTHPLPTKDGEVIEARTDAKNAASIILTYDANWGGGRGAWFTASNTVFATGMIFQWRLYDVIEPKEK